MNTEQKKDDLIIRKMSRDEVSSLAIEWAAAEGWNPGLYDMDAFYSTDPDGFTLGEINGMPVGCISVVKYKEDFCFLGFYIVKPEFRGKGYGVKIWNEAIKDLKEKNIGLDGVVAQQENYRKSGFKFEYSNIRYEGTGQHYNVNDIIGLNEIPFDKLKLYDRKFFPAERDEFLRRWINQPEGKGCAMLANNELCGYGFIRKCRAGYKIGPLFAENFEIAEQLFVILQNEAAGEKFYLDIPEVNGDALKLVKKYDMKKVFETARMYTKKAPSLPLGKIFGVTSFELG